jgi:hypothetical protein
MREDDRKMIYNFLTRPRMTYLGDTFEGALNKMISQIDQDKDTTYFVKKIMIDSDLKNINQPASALPQQSEKNN